MTQRAGRAPGSKIASWGAATAPLAALLLVISPSPTDASIAPAGSAQLPRGERQLLPSGCNVAVAAWVGDGYCDGPPGSSYNSEACNWDGGDCCSHTCVSSTYPGYPCTLSGYSCHEGWGTVGVTLPTGCNAPIDYWVGDGWCDTPSTSAGGCAPPRPPLPSRLRPYRARAAHAVRRRASPCRARTALGTTPPRATGTAATAARARA
jgi:hypothetical protein